MTRVCIHLACALCVAFALSATTAAFAQDGEETKKIQRIVITNPLAAAQRLIAEGHLDAADKILTAILAAPPERGAKIDLTQVKFLLAEVARRQERFSDAIALYRAILDNRPELTRVRLELARTYFLARKDGKAKYNFEFVLAGNPEPAVARNVMGFLRAIDDRRRWRFGLSIAAAPDSNVNSATNDEIVELFGLPFNLSEDAQESSGIGAIFSGSAAYHQPLSKKLRLILGADARHAEYSGDTFDDTLLSANVGPRYRTGRWIFGLFANGHYRRFGGETFNRSVGLSGQVFRRQTERLTLGATFGWRDVSFPNNSQRSGSLWDVETSLSYGLSATSLIRLGVGFERESARVESLANKVWSARLVYIRQLPLGLTVRLAPSVRRRRFDAAQVAFGEQRRETRIDITIELTKRDWAVFGFVPTAGYTYSRNFANIDFFDFDRHRGLVGVTRRF